MNKWITLSIQFDLNATNVEHNNHNGTKKAIKIRTKKQIPYLTQTEYTQEYDSTSSDFSNSTKFR